MRRPFHSPVLFAGSVLGLGLLGSACYEDPGVLAGEVSGSNKFRYVCDESAAVEDCSGTASVFPAAIAKGSKFRLSIDAASANEVDELRPISSEVVGTDPSGAWVCGTDGIAGFVAFDRNGYVVDYVHVKVETPTRLAVESYGSTITGYDRSAGSAVSSATVRVGAKLNLSATPFGKSSAPLAGAVPYAWTPDTDGIVRVATLGSPTSPSAFVTVTGVKVGTTRIRVEGAGVSTDLEVTVQ